MLCGFQSELAFLYCGVVFLAGESFSDLGYNVNQFGAGFTLQFGPFAASVRDCAIDTFLIIGKEISP